MDCTQADVLEALMHTKDNLFITGGAGTGKSYIINKWLTMANKQKILVCAPTGVAALNLRGQTLHRTFSIPFSIADTKFHPAKVAKFLKREKRILLRKVHTLLIDEISMTRSDVLDFISTLLKEVRENCEPFGGLRLIAIGDPYQLPPVVPKHEAERLPCPWFFQSESWNLGKIKTMNLIEIQRQKDDLTFANLLNNIRTGKMTMKDMLELNKRVVEEPSKTAIILATTNRTAESINGRELSKLDEQKWVFEMRFENYEEGFYIEKMVPAQETLTLKIGARVMMLNNNSNEDGTWVNGSLGTILDIREDEETEEIVIEVELDNGEEVIVRKNEWVAEESTIENNEIKTKTLGKAWQYPVKLGYAITVHKSQGLTFKEMHFALDFVFECGQTYVALSRATTLAGLSMSRRIGSKHVIADDRVYEYMSGGQE